MNNNISSGTVPMEPRSNNIEQSNQRVEVNPVLPSVEGGITETKIPQKPTISSVEASSGAAAINLARNNEVDETKPLIPKLENFFSVLLGKLEGQTPSSGFGSEKQPFAV